jgi:probable addiction module antidote protein
MNSTTKPWDAAEFLGSATDVRHYLEAAFEDGDPALIRHAFNAVARARHDRIGPRDRHLA